MAIFANAAASPGECQPNLVIIYSDDLGYGDLGSYGSELHNTPHLDRLAERGARMTDFYMTSPVCTPSRVALLTGRHPARVGFDTLLWPTSEGGLPHTERTIAEFLKEHGYATGLFGKWHLGHSEEAYLPMFHGFDEWYGMPYPNDMDPDHPQTQWRDEPWPDMPMMRGAKVVERPVDVNLLTQQYTAQAVGFIAEHHHEPFFLFLSHAMPHTIIGASPDFIGTSANGLYGDAVQELDWSTGEIMRALRAFGLEDETMVIFTSDNGAVHVERFGGEFNETTRRFHPDLSFGSNGPLRGGKQTTYEGGVRVPGIIYWPGVVPAGAVVEEPAWVADLFPTFAGLAGLPLPDDRDYDGISLQPVLRTGAKALPDRPFVFGGENPNAMRWGEWKLVMPNQPRFVTPDSDEPMLYNLAEDIGETNNLAGEHPEILTDMLNRFDQIVAEMHADTISR
ncbi:MAG: sulfatase [Opitutales bacterium]